MKRQTKKGDEVDLTTRAARRAIRWRRGETTAIKKRMNRRERRTARQALTGGC